MNMILHELKRSLKGLCIWCIGILLLISGASTELETLMNESFDIAEMMRVFPEAMYKALSFDLISFNTPEGYFSYIGEYLTMLSALYAVLAGTNILSKELRRKTSETLFTLPVKREQIIGRKFAAAAIDCFIFAAVLYIGTIASFSRFSPTDAFYHSLPIYFLIVFLVEIIFLAGGLFISMFARDHKKTGMIGAGITLALYLMTFLVGLHESFSYLKYITPFEYFSSIDILRGEPLPIYGFIISACLLTLFLTGSFRGIRSKDIPC